MPIKTLKEKGKSNNKSKSKIPPKRKNQLTDKNLYGKKVEKKSDNTDKNVYSK